MHTPAGHAQIKASNTDKHSTSIPTAVRGIRAQAWVHNVQLQDSPTTRAQDVVVPDMELFGQRRLDRAEHAFLDFR